MRDPRRVQGAQLRPHARRAARRSPLRRRGRRARCPATSSTTSSASAPLVAGHDDARRVDAGVARQQLRYASYSTCARRLGQERRRRVAVRDVAPRAGRAAARRPRRVRARRTRGPVRRRRRLRRRRTPPRPTGCSRREVQVGHRDAELAVSASSTWRRAGRPTGVPNTHSTAVGDAPAEHDGGEEVGGEPAREVEAREREQRAPGPRRSGGSAGRGAATRPAPSPPPPRGAPSGSAGAPVRSKVTRNACHSPSSCTRKAISRPRTQAATAADREVAGQAPAAEQQDGDHQQAHRPQRRELVEDQEERPRAGAGSSRRAGRRLPRWRWGGAAWRISGTSSSTASTARAASPGRRRVVPSVRSRVSRPRAGRAAATGPCPSPTLPRAPCVACVSRAWWRGPLPVT